MTRRTIIFGNGLGMALSPEYFDLDGAMGRVWADESLSAGHRELICKCLPPTGSELIASEVLTGYDGALVDGMYDAGFAPENLDRKHGHTFGYYMHLHGSPLFVNRRDAIVKLAQGTPPRESDVVGSHIVLTHVAHKPAVISASVLLTEYWSRLLQAFGESKEIILVGYSGLDEHLNNIIVSASPDKPVRVVEWAGVSNKGARLRFWRRQLARDNIRLVQRESILSFEDWGNRARQ